jgi:ATP-dependent exoDNAse (exonuclease V) alpha subunit
MTGSQGQTADTTHVYLDSTKVEREEPYVGATREKLDVELERS